MKRLIFIFLAFFLVLSACGIDEESSKNKFEKVLIEGFEGIKKRDNEKIKKSFGRNSSFLVAKEEKTSGENKSEEILGSDLYFSEDLFKIYMEKFQYEVDTIDKVEDFEANVLIKNLNFKKLIEETLDKVYESIKKDEEGIAKAKYDKDNFKSLFLQEFKNLVDNSEDFEEKKVKVRSSSFLWFMSAKEDPELVNAVYGNLLNDRDSLEVSIKKKSQAFYEDLNVNRR